MQKFIVPQLLPTKTRLDHFLAQKLNLSRNKVQQLIQDQNILVNEKLVLKTGYFLEVNDVITVLKTTLNDHFLTGVPPFALDLDVCYEDAEILVIHKPSNILSHPTINQETNTITNALAHYFLQKNLNPNIIRSGIAHRLDKDTSGLMLVAKTEASLKNILEQFAQKLVVKKYSAIVLNFLPSKHLMINLPIGRSNDGTIKMQINGPKDLKDAKTEVFEIEKLHHHSLVECHLHTGRTHQIRVHLAAIKCPVLNDYLYGHTIQGDVFGQYLHATYLKFKHPKTNQVMEFSSQWPLEFENKLNELRQQVLSNQD